MGDLTALLLDAKAEYRLQMEDIVTPSVAETITTMWNDSMREGGSRDGILYFQQKLRSIPGWNASVISSKTKEIIYMYPYFEDLIAACIIAQLKIMSSIKLSQDKPTVQLKLPSSDTFLHEVYIQTAKKVYEDPFILSGKSNTVLVLGPIVSDAIEKTIRKLIPFKDVLLAYLQGGGNQGLTKESLDVHSDDSSGGSFPKRQTQSRDSDDGDTQSSSSDDEDVHVPVQGPQGYSPSQPQIYTPQPQIYTPQPHQPPQPPPPPPPPPPQPEQQPPPHLEPYTPPLQQTANVEHEYAAPLFGQEPKKQTLFSSDPALRQGF